MLHNDRWSIKLTYLQYRTRTPVFILIFLKQRCLKYACPTFSHYLPPNSIRCPLLCCLILLCCICSMRVCFICGWPNFQVWSRRRAESVYQQSDRPAQRLLHKLKGSTAHNTCPLCLSFWINPNNSSICAKCSFHLLLSLKLKQNITYFNPA